MGELDPGSGQSSDKCVGRLTGCRPPLAALVHLLCCIPSADEGALHNVHISLVLKKQTTPFWNREYWEAGSDPSLPFWAILLAKHFAETLVKEFLSLFSYLLEENFNPPWNCFRIPWVSSCLALFWGDGHTPISCCLLLNLRDRWAGTSTGLESVHQQWSSIF